MNDHSAVAHSCHAGSACAVAHPLEESSWLRGVRASEKDGMQRRESHFVRYLKRDTMKPTPATPHPPYNGRSKKSLIRAKRGSRERRRSQTMTGKSENGSEEARQRRRGAVIHRQASRHMASLCRPLVASQEECLVTR